MVRTPLVPAVFLLSGILASVSATGCSSDDDKATSSPPDGVSCAKVVSATDEESLVSGLASVGAGGCVVLTGSVTSTLPVVVGADVRLVGAKGDRAARPVTTGAVGAITVTGDKAQLGNFDLLGAPGTGVAIVARSVKLFDVKVTGAKKAAVAVLPGTESGATATLENVVIEKSTYGLYAQGEGVEVTMTGGRVGENGGTSLSSGVGVVAAGGAKLILDGVTVEKNEGTGVLFDGKSTRGLIKGSTIAENRERGIGRKGSREPSKPRRSRSRTRSSRRTASSAWAGSS